MGRLRVMTVLGTRPEIIRLSRVIARLDESFDHVLVHTGQNFDYGLNEVFFDEMEIRVPDHFLGVDTSTLGHVLGGTLIGMEELLLRLEPDVLLVLGDTNSSIAAVIAKRLRVPVYHMEAGNRCFDENVPEEVNRRLVDHVADFNLVYTEHARRNLLAEGLPTRRIGLSGSPMREVLNHYASGIAETRILEKLGLESGRYLVVSAHREENVDDANRLRMFLATLEALRSTHELPVIVSTHPRTRKRLDQLLVSEVDGIRFHDPFGFLDFVKLQQHARCVLSDSGTISEESTILGFPAVTLRDAIERPEALEAGGIISTGLDADVVLDAVQLVIRQHAAEGPVPLPPGYEIDNCSRRVVNFIRSTAHISHDWAGIRRRPAS
jgi:UDP-N-acetylglucosamine 2-epimerase